ncbi:MAG: hypothetical protein V8Q84_00555 [Bilophila sp.]
MLGGIIVHAACLSFGWLDTPARIVFSATPPDTNLLWWALGEVRNLASIFCIIFAVMLLQRLLRHFRVADLVGQGPRPGPAPPPYAPGRGHHHDPQRVVTGILYASGIILKEARSGELSRHDVFSAMTFMGLAHAIIEDTCLMLLIGAHLGGIFFLRLALAFAVCALINVMYLRVGRGCGNRPDPPSTRRVGMKHIWNQARGAFRRHAGRGAAERLREREPESGPRAWAGPTLRPRRAKEPLPRGGAFGHGHCGSARGPAPRPSDARAHQGGTGGPAPGRRGAGGRAGVRFSGWRRSRTASGFRSTTWCPAENLGMADRARPLPATPRAAAFLHPAFRADFYARYGVAVDYVGNPLVDMVQWPELETLSPVSGRIGLMPGSRREENEKASCPVSGKRPASCSGRGATCVSTACARPT